MRYEIIWSSPWNQGSKKVDTAAMADARIDEFVDKGADAIKVLRDGRLIERTELPALIAAETKEYQERSDAHRT